MPVAVLPIVSLSEVSRIRAAVALSACPWAALERSSRVRLTVATPLLKNALQTFKKAHKTQFPGAFTLCVARQSGWEHSDNQDGHFGGRGARIFVAAWR